MIFFLVYEILSVLLLFGLTAAVLRYPSLHRSFLLLCIALAILVHLRFGVNHPVAFTGDSSEYIEWTHHWKENSMAIRRPPLYPLFLRAFTSERAGLKDPVLLQHLLMASLVPLVFLLGLQSGLSRGTALFAALLVAIDPLLVQSGQEIMSEALSTIAVVLCALALVALVKKPTYARAALLAAAFAQSSHIRATTDILFALIMGGLLFWDWRRNRLAHIKAIVLAAVVFAALNAPMSFLNLRTHGVYNRSHMQGLILLTKSVSYNLINPGAPEFHPIQAAYDKSMRQRGLPPGYRSPDLLADWDLNAVPHDIMFDLVFERGMSYMEVDRLMSSIAISSFLHSPFWYAKSILDDLNRLLFECREFYPDPRILLGFEKQAAPNGGPLLFLLRFARGMVHPSSWFLIAGALLWIFLRSRNRLTWNLPGWGLLVIAGFFIYGYLLTAAVQIGLTRYTVPWLPFRAILIAAGLDLMFSTLAPRLYQRTKTC